MESLVGGGGEAGCNALSFVPQEIINQSISRSVSQASKIQTPPQCYDLVSTVPWSEWCDADGGRYRFERRCWGGIAYQLRRSSLSEYLAVEPFW